MEDHDVLAKECDVLRLEVFRYKELPQEELSDASLLDKLRLSEQRRELAQEEADRLEGERDDLRDALEKAQSDFQIAKSDHKQWRKEVEAVPKKQFEECQPLLREAQTQTAEDNRRLQGVKAVFGQISECAVKGETLKWDILSHAGLRVHLGDRSGAMSAIRPIGTARIPRWDPGE